MRVNIDYHIEVDRHFYSVPYPLVGEQLEARSTAYTVEIFHRGKRVASHLRRLHRLENLLQNSTGRTVKRGFRGGVRSFED